MTNLYADQTHDNILVTQDTRGTLSWRIHGKAGTDGMSQFIANGSFGVAVFGVRLVLQDNQVYALQVDGTWLQGYRFSAKGVAKPANITVNDPVQPPAVVIPPPDPGQPGGTGATGATGGPQPPTTDGTRILVSRSATNWIYANVDAQGLWQKLGGCYVDANGVENGPTSYVTQALTSSPTQTVDVSKIDGDLFIRVPTLSAPWGSTMALDGTTLGVNDAFWIANGAPSQLMPARYGDPVLVLNDGRAATLTFSTAGAADAGKIIHVDKVQGPLVVDPPVVPQVWKGGNVVGVTGKVLDIDMTSRDNIKSYMRPSGDYQPGDTPGSIAYGEQYLIEPLTGMRFIRFTTSPPVNGNINERLISWFFYFAATIPDMFCGFGVRLGTDVRTGMYGDGVKLSGGGVAVSGRTVSFTAEHDKVSPRNLGLYGLEMYKYDADGPQILTPMNCTMRDARWYWIEMRARMNSAPGVADGIQQMRVNGTMTYSNTAKKIRTVANDEWGVFHGQVYDGGVGSPLGPMTYDAAHYVVRDDDWPGIPPDMLALLQAGI